MRVGICLALWLSLAAHANAQGDLSLYCPGFEGVILKTSGPCPAALPEIKDRKPPVRKEAFRDYSRISLDDVNELLPQYNEKTDELIPVDPEVETVQRAIQGAEDAQ